MNILQKTMMTVSAACFLSLAGCGGLVGEGTKEATGSLKIQVRWPDVEVGRLIPDASNSIEITVRDGATVLQTVLIERPEDTAVLDEMPLKQLSFTATAYPSADGSGVAQASATELYTVVEGAGNVVAITMDSTIDHLVAAPANLNLVALETETVVVTPKNASNETVLVAAGNITFSSSNSLIASVGGLSGQVTGLLFGITTVTATESDSGISVDIPVQVGLGLDLTPSSVNMNILAGYTFSATVTGSGNTSVTWSVDGGAANGTIDSNGVYTAPNSAGTYTIRATSNADPSVSSTSTVVVKSGTGTVIVD